MQETYSNSGTKRKKLTCVSCFAYWLKFCLQKLKMTRKNTRAILTPTGPKLHLFVPFTSTPVNALFMLDLNMAMKLGLFILHYLV